MLLLLLTLLSLCAATPVATSCTQQLNTFYVQLGLSPLAPVIAPVTFVAGFDGPTPIVTATLNFQGVAQTYQAAISGPPPTPTVVGISFDLPWCVTQINTTCASLAVHGLGKVDNCLIIDFDQGGSSQIAGRIWLYVNESCGTPTVTFYNVALSGPPSISGVYTYNTQGLLPPYPTLSAGAAMAFYQNSSCAYSNGDVTDAQAQGQFVCLAQSIVCNTTRTNGQPSAPVVPVPAFQCLGNLTANSTQAQFVISVSSYDAPGAITGFFYLQFCEPANVLCMTQFQQQILVGLPPPPSYSLVAGTRRQFISPFTDFGQTVLLSYNGIITSFALSYTFAPNDAVARVVPCICDFSVACDAAGNVFNASTSIAQELSLDNALPLPYPGAAFSFPQGQAAIELSANASYDPDHAPGPFSLYWKIYSQPPGSPPVVIDEPMRAVQDLNSSLFLAGNYLFLLYVSDSQTVTFALLNVTVINNIITVIIAMDDIQFTPFCGESPSAESTCPGAGGHPLSFFMINGSLTSSTNPSVPLTYTWMQTAGAPTPLVLQCVTNCIINTAQMWNESTPVLIVTPQNIGLYGYNLTVTDGQVTASADVTFYVLPDFLQPQGPDVPLPNYTLPPIRNITLIEAPVVQFTNVTYNITPTASFPPTSGGGNGTVPPVFPNYGPPTTDELFVLFMAYIAALFWLMLVLLVYIVEKPGDTFSHLDHTEYTVDSF